MNIPFETYNSKFGLLTIGEGPENNFVWRGNIDISNSIFSGQIPIYIFTKELTIPSNVIDLAEIIVLNIDQYLEKSILFIKQTLTEQPENIKSEKMNMIT